MIIVHTDKQWSPVKDKLSSYTHTHTQRELREVKTMTWAPPQASREMDPPEERPESVRSWGKSSSWSLPVPSWPSVPAPQLHTSNSSSSSSSLPLSFPSILLPLSEHQNPKDGLLPVIRSTGLTFRTGSERTITVWNSLSLYFPKKKKKQKPKYSNLPKYFGPLLINGAVFSSINAGGLLSGSGLPVLIPRTHNVFDKLTNVDKLNLI